MQIMVQLAEPCLDICPIPITDTFMHQSTQFYNRVYQAHPIPQLTGTVTGFVVRDEVSVALEKTSYRAGKEDRMFRRFTTA
jgi:hypothetical protein